MKKILSLLACVCLLFTTIMIPASAAETSATISFATKDARVSQDASSQVWSANGLTVTNNKGASTSPVADYANPVRFYKNSDVIIEYPGMTKIEIDVTGVPATNKNAWVNSCSDATLDGNTVTITLAAPADSYTITLTAAQARAMAITVYAADGNEGGGDVTPPAEPEVKTIAEVLAMEDSDTKFIVTAEIVETYGNSWATYGNFKLKDDSTDETIILYGLKDENGNRYDAMETKPVVGDTVKVIANRGSYNGAGQLNNAVLLELTPATPDEGGDDVTPPADPEVKTIAEILAMEDSDTKFIVTAEIVDTYRDTWATYGNFILKDDSTDTTIIMYGLKDENGNRYDAMETKPVVGDTIKVIANRSSYQGVPQLGNAVLVELTPATPDQGGDDNTGNEGGDENTGNEGGEDAALSVVKNPVAGTAYKFGMVQENLGKTLYITGEMSSYYYATTEDPEAAADVYLEETEGGYYMYALVNGAKKYMNIIEATGTDGKVHINAVFGDTAISVFTYDATLETFVTALGEKSYGLGTRGDANYNTVSPSASEYVDNFFCSFYAEASTDDNTGNNNTDDDNTPDDDNTTSPSTGVGGAGALAVMAIAAAAAALSKKRA